jgi:hypothetical protein
MERLVKIHHNPNKPGHARAARFYENEASSLLYEDIGKKEIDLMIINDANTIIWNYFNKKQLDINEDDFKVDSGHVIVCNNFEDAVGGEMARYKHPYIYIPKGMRESPLAYLRSLIHEKIHFLGVNHEIIDPESPVHDIRRIRRTGFCFQEIDKSNDFQSWFTAFNEAMTETITINVVKYSLTNLNTNGLYGCSAKGPSNMEEDKAYIDERKILWEIIKQVARKMGEESSKIFNLFEKVYFNNSVSEFNELERIVNDAYDENAWKNLQNLKIFAQEMSAEERKRNEEIEEYFLAPGKELERRARVSWLKSNK